MFFPLSDILSFLVINTLFLSSSCICKKVDNKTIKIVIDGEKFDYPTNAIPVIVLACNRVTVSICLDSLIKYRPSIARFPIIVSQDGDHQETTKVIQSYQNEIHFMKQILLPSEEKKEYKGYYKIARHYKWILNKVFTEFKFNTAIIIEDDLEIAPDLFEYFLGTYPLLIRDPTLWCISAWNDNGKSNLIDTNSPELLYRTDFFPGLGWMLTRELWFELSPKWPTIYWDDWMRHPQTRKDRACIRPEVSRTKTFGLNGVSEGLFYDEYLKYIHLNDKFIQFTKLNLTYLLRENYEIEYVEKVLSLPTVTLSELKMNTIQQKDAVRIVYDTKDKFLKIAHFIGLMEDIRYGMPRTAYKGIGSVFYKSRRVFLTPSSIWSAYDLTWTNRSSCHIFSDVGVTRLFILILFILVC
ncbi:hypothetical protein WDU94_001157 [Cyamophila willieti]